jgi:hypothetical protein
MRNGVLAKSIIKRYIAGELGLNDVTHPLKTHKSIVAVDYDFRKNLLNNCKSDSKMPSSLNKLNKRMTLSPDKLISQKKLHKSFSNINININDNNTIYSNKSDNSCISEEKDEEGICLKCKDTNNENGYHLCSNNIFGCLKTRYDNCLRCDNLKSLFECTECKEGYTKKNYGCEKIQDEKENENENENDN